MTVVTVDTFCTLTKCCVLYLDMLLHSHSNPVGAGGVGGQFCFHHFTHNETEAHGGNLTCLKSHSQKVVELELVSSQSRVWFQPLLNFA